MSEFCRHDADYLAPLVEDWPSAVARIDRGIHLEDPLHAFRPYRGNPAV